VLCYPNRERDRLFEALRRAGILCQKHDERTAIRLADPSVKVLSVRSAKGLEFPVVYLLSSARHFRPPPTDPEDRAAWLAETRRVFYMAMTRAMHELVLVYAEPTPAPFLAHLAGGSGPG
jgi:superfamily I DNA/RNA helicase